MSTQIGSSESNKRHTLIVGLGLTGMSCLRFLYGEEQLTVVDTRSKPEMLDEARKSYPGVTFVCGDIPDAIFTGVHRLVVSPGVALDLPLFAGSLAKELPVISDIDLFLDASTVPVIGITGTNGKSTVTELCGTLLAAIGMNVGVGGNLGVPALDLLGNATDIYVLELSSFQLERLRLCGNLCSNEHKVIDAINVGCLLNISADHLDRHGDYESYVGAKRRIINLSDVLVYNRDDSQTASKNLDQARISFGSDTPGNGNWGLIDVGEGLESRSFLSFSGQPYLEVSALRIRGAHNVLNALAALALATTQHSSVEDFKAALMDFEGLKHRCQTVAFAEGITYINDSKATNVGACLAALEGLGNAELKNIVLIAGGDAKDADMSSLKEAIASFVKYMIVIGKDAGKLADVATSSDTVAFAGNMLEAVKRAACVASAGDLVLLSPACASFDMYSGFEARGADFVESVERVAVAG